MADHLFQPGDELLNGRYRIEVFIGEGAFGEVYRVRDVQLDRVIAIKVLRRDMRGVGADTIDEYHTRFNLEADLTAQVHEGETNPHVIQVFHFELDKSSDLLVEELEYAPTIDEKPGNLATLIQRANKKNERIAIADALRYAREIAEGLAALHKLLIVHRDIKPSNILIGADGKAKVADLGVAQTMQTNRTGAGTAQIKRDHPGTDQYMPLEQRSGHYAALKSSADVYALGCVLFELLTGELYYNQRRGTRVKTLRPDVPSEVDDLLAQMLADDTEQRPRNGAEMAKLLDACERAWQANSTAKLAALQTQQAEAERKHLAELKRAEDEKRRREQLEKLGAWFKKFSPRIAVALIVFALAGFVGLALLVALILNLSKPSPSSIAPAITSFTPRSLPTATVFTAASPSVTQLPPTKSSNVPTSISIPTVGFITTSQITFTSSSLITPTVVTTLTPEESRFSGVHLYSTRMTCDAKTSFAEKDQSLKQVDTKILIEFPPTGRMNFGLRTENLDQFPVIADQFERSGTLVEQSWRSTKPFQSVVPYLEPLSSPRREATIKFEGLNFFLTYSYSSQGNWISCKFMYGMLY